MVSCVVKEPLKLKVVNYIEVHKSMVSFGYNKEQLILQVV